MTEKTDSPTFKSNPNPGKLNTSFWESAFKKDEEAKKPKKVPKKMVSLYGKSFYADKETEEPVAEKPAVVVIGGDDDDKEAEPEDKTGMIQVRGKCSSLGCKCDKYVVPTSKWAKGKCKSCDHAPEKHKQEWRKEKDVEDEANEAAAALAAASSTDKPKTPTTAEPEPAAQAEPEPEALENLWGEEFTDKLKECVSNTFEYDERSILQGKHLLYYLKKRVGFEFTGQTKHAAALKFVSVDLFGWKVINKYGYNVRVK